MRVGLFLDSAVQPRWHRQIIADVASASSAELALVVVGPGGPAPPAVGRPSVDHLLYRLWRRIDELLFLRGRATALDPVDVSDLIRDCPRVEVGPPQGDGAGRLATADVLRIAEYGLDVGLSFGFEPRWDGVPQIARHGVWAYRFGNRPETRGAPLGIREVLERHPVAEASLRMLAGEPGGDERVVYGAHLRTDPLSIHRHCEHVCEVSAEFVGRSLRLLEEEGLQASSLARCAGPSDRTDVVPGNREMARMLARFATRVGAEGLRRVFYRDQWILACSTPVERDGPGPDLSALRRLLPPTDRFWADPFPVSINNRTYIFLEELPYSTNKGHISVIELDDEGYPGSPRRVLERDYHLSYPFVFEYRGNMYMVPESTGNGTVDLYRCVEFPCRWELDRTLLSGVHAADPTFVERDGLWWMFASVVNDREELCLFHAESPLGPWRPHRRNPVKTDVRSSRPAGQLFRRGDEWYRPSQDCTMGYGSSMVINRITRWDLDGYEEHEAARILPDWEPGLDRTHTLNACDTLVVVDARIGRPRLESLWQKSVSGLSPP